MVRREVEREIHAASAPERGEVVGKARGVQPGGAGRGTLIGTILLVPGLMLFMLVVWVLNKIVPEAPLSKPSPKAKRV